jgi:hypothetical protein
MLLIVMSAEQHPDLMPHLPHMNSNEHQLLKQHLLCLPEVLNKFTNLKVKVLSDRQVSNITSLSNLVLKKIHELQESIAAPKPKPKQKSMSSQKKRALLNQPFSSSKKRRFPTDRQKEGRKKRPTYTALDGTQHSNDDEDDEDDDDDEEDEEDDDDDIMEEDKGDTCKTKAKDQEMEIEEEIEEFDSTSPSPNEVLLGSFAQNNSLNVSDIKKFLGNYDALLGSFAKNNSLNVSDIKNLLEKYDA